MGRKKAASRPTVGFRGTNDASAVPMKSISTTSSGFEVQATKNGILLSSSSTRPENFEDLVSHLNRDRQSVSPTPSMYEEYVDAVTTAPNKATTSHETVTLLKGYGDGYSRAWNQAFTAYPKNVGFNNGLSAPQPHFVQGLRQLEFDPFRVGVELDAAVLYADDQNSIALPHFAGEWKGPGKGMAQAALQSAYDGAALVHSRNEALAYMGMSDPAGHASVLTVTTDGRDVNIFGHYAEAPSACGDKTWYHQYLLFAAHMDHSYEDFKKGRKQLRNAQDFARDQSSRLRDQLQDYWRTQQQGPNGPSSAHSLPDSSEDVHGAARMEGLLPSPSPNLPPTTPPNHLPSRPATSGGAGLKRRAPSPSSSRPSKASKGQRSEGAW